MNRSGILPHLSVALAVLAASLALAACGSDDGGTTQVTTSTVTTLESEGTAAETATAGNTVTPEVSQATADSDAAASIPGEQAAVAEADTAAATTTTTPTATTTTPTATTTPAPTTAAPTTTAPTTTAPTTTAPTTAAPTTAAPATTPTTGVPATGVTPVIPASPVLPGTAGAILARPFSSSSPWNTLASGDRVDRNSERWMKLAQVRVAAVELPNGRTEQQRRTITEGLTVNVTKWTVPVFSDQQQGAIPRVAVCRQFNCGPDAVTAVTIPPDACPDPRYDGWMTAIDTTTRTALDFWRGRCEADGSLSYHYVKRWDLDGPGFQAPLEVSARGSGLPLFAGLITPEEVRDGRIDHALAISVPGAAQRRYVQPASRTDGTGPRSSLPEGARIRLRSGAIDLLSKDLVRNNVQRRTASTIITALQRYGAIVVDRSAAPTLYAQRNAQWTGILPLNLVQDIGLQNFEVVDAGQILFDPPRGGELTTASALPPGTPGSIPGTASGSQGTTDFNSPSGGYAP